MMKIPPIEKIPEAYSAIADERITLGENQAEVRSSDGNKTYTVRWDGDMFASDDSATYWQGYPGYPVLAVLMLQGRLPLNRETAAHFKGVNWTELNKKHKRNYANAVAEVLEGLHTRDVDIEAVKAEFEQVYRLLPDLNLTIKRSIKGK